MGILAVRKGEGSAKRYEPGGWGSACRAANSTRDQPVFHAGGYRRGDRCGKGAHLPGLGRWDSHRDDANAVHRNCRGRDRGPCRRRASGPRGASGAGLRPVRRPAPGGVWSGDPAGRSGGAGPVRCRDCGPRLGPADHCAFTGSRLSTAAPSFPSPMTAPAARATGWRSTGRPVRRASGCRCPGGCDHHPRCAHPCRPLGGQTLAGDRTGRHGPFDLVVDAAGAGSALSPLQARPLPYGAVWATVPWPKAQTSTPTRCSNATCAPAGWRASCRWAGW